VCFQASLRSACMPSVTENTLSLRIYPLENCTDHKEHENVTGALCIWSPKAWAICSTEKKDKIIECRWLAEQLVVVEDFFSFLLMKIKIKFRLRVEAEGHWPTGAGVLPCCWSSACWTAWWAPGWQQPVGWRKGLWLWVNWWWVRASFPFGE